MKLEGSRALSGTQEYFGFKNTSGGGEVGSEQLCETLGVKNLED